MIANASAMTAVIISNQSIHTKNSSSGAESSSRRFASHKTLCCARLDKYWSLFQISLAKPMPSINVYWKQEIVPTEVE